MQLLYIILKLLRKIHIIYNQIVYLWKDRNVIEQTKQYQKYVELFDQSANDYVRELLHTGKPCMVSKFGGFELSHLVQQIYLEKDTYTLKDYWDYIIEKKGNLWWPTGVDYLCRNAGFFPNDQNLLKKYFQVNYQAIKMIDVLGSYLEDEKHFEKELVHAKRINLDGYYAPFLFNNPWTKELKGKRVLVIHPFSDDIKSQYEKKELLWKDKDILPEFKLITYRSVQSMLGIKTEFNTWFDALQKMEDDISKIEFDVALIGCGAYGMPLAGFVKSLGKQAIHTAGWTQILFGIIGKRWEDDSRMDKYINEYWIHPSPSNIPEEAKKIEGGCYW
ncbi:MAG: hypothetical protein MJZ41_02325 [Bacteroidaceae bacterium]|nr:hypothetical protein [Bacteroidaceae bacterium]